MNILLLLPAVFALALVGCDNEPEQPSVPPSPPVQEQQAPAPAEPMPSEPMPAEPAPAEPAEDEYEQ
jgi:hypothetical protein